MKKLLEAIDDLIWDYIRSPYNVFMEKLINALAYGRMGWNQKDWEPRYIYIMLNYKLKRIQKAVVDEGHHVYDKKTVQSLRLAIKLSDRIFKHNYHYFMDQHIKEFGELPKIGKRLPEKRRAAFSKAYEMDEAQEARDRKLFWAIMEKYNNIWWD